MVIAIVVVSIAPIQPAAQAAREAARRARCIDNLKPLGIAHHIDHDTLGRWFPFGAIADPQTNDWLLQGVPGAHHRHGILAILSPSQV